MGYPPLRAKVGITNGRCISRFSAWFNLFSGLFKHELPWTVQQEVGEMKPQKSKFDGLARLLNRIGGSRVLPAALEERLASAGNADDHRAAALLYQEKARELEAEAVEFDTAVLKIGPYEDSKGFRNGALKTAAQQKRYRAKQMQELHAAHLKKARLLQGTAQSE